MEEVWLPVKGFEGYYEVSSFGKIRGVDRLAAVGSGGTRLVLGTHRKFSVSTKGYFQVLLSKNGRVYTKSVHRLVAEAFIRRVDGKDQVNHIDGDKQNNVLSNLEWCNNSENAIHAFRLGLRVPNNFRKTGSIYGMTCEDVYCKIVELTSEGLTQKEIGDTLGIHRVTVNRCLMRHRKLKDNTLGR